MPFCSSDNTPALSPSTQSGRGTYSREPRCEGRPANCRSQEDGGGEGWSRSTSTGLWRPLHPILVGLGSDASGGALLPVTSTGLGGWTPLSQVCPSLSGPCQRNSQRARHGDPGGAQGPGAPVTRCGSGDTLSFLGAWWGGGRSPGGSHPWALFSVQLLSEQGLGLERWSLMPRGGAWSFFGTGLQLPLCSSALPHSPRPTSPGSSGCSFLSARKGRGRGIRQGWGACLFRVSNTLASGPLYTLKNY